MAYIKINDENKTQFCLNENPEESSSGTGYWYLKLSLICNLPADEFSKIFIPENLDRLEMVDNQDQRVVFVAYNQIVSVRRAYNIEDIKARVLYITLQKKISQEEGDGI